MYKKNEREIRRTARSKTYTKDRQKKKKKEKQQFFLKNLRKVHGAVWLQNKLEIKESKKTHSSADSLVMLKNL